VAAPRRLGEDLPGRQFRERRGSALTISVAYPERPVMTTAKAGLAQGIRVGQPLEMDAWSAFA
jgi:hypothetical protein